MRYFAKYGGGLYVGDGASVTFGDNAQVNDNEAEVRVTGGALLFR